MRTAILFILFFPTALAQGQDHHSVHQEELEHYKSLDIQREAEWDSLHGIEKMASRGARSCSLQKVVYGWHPFWMGSAYTNYQWDLLSHFSYFSFEVDPNTGYPSTTHNWLSASSVTAAQNNGVKADLCVTLFSDHSTFLSSSSSRQNLIDTLISLVQARNANGVNIDFENIPSSQGTAYNNFLVDLATQMHNQIPGSEVSVALFSVDWNNIFDMSLLDQHLDHFIIMGYGYHYSGSSVAGPTAPLYNFGSGTRNLSRTVNYYLNEGASPSKLVLGLPYYGYEWETASDQVPENTTSSGNSRTYTNVRDNVSGNYSTANKGWHFDSRSNHYIFQESGTWHQCFVDLARGLDERYDLIHRRGLAGMGIWALGYDDGYTALWNEIEENFTDCRTVPCTDTLYDMGGPGDPYYNDEHYVHTIDPSGSGPVELDFQNFDIENGYDSLWIYDGGDTTSPLIGGYSGAVGPGTVISSGEALTVEFESDGATTAPGWTAIWNCLPDSSAPGTDIGTLLEWVTDDFNVSFSDSDNAGGSGIDKAFYQVLHKENGSDYWSGNEKAGFFHDGFRRSGLHPDWTIDTGNWASSGDSLLQTDESLSNTNLYAPLDQSLSDRYLYHWNMKMDGNGSNRRAGLHYFCDSAELSNRGDSYFVWFRLDDDLIQLYKVVNNSWGTGPVHEVPYNFQEGEWYDMKLSFDRISGNTQVYVDGERELVWNDTTPHASGNAISFRTGNARSKVSHISVHRSRDPTETVRIGPGGKEDIRYQNQGPTLYGGRVASIVQDQAGNLSPIVKDSLKVDTTAPFLGPLRDGDAPPDKDTILNPSGSLSANWDASFDPHSGIQHYRYAIGQSPGDTGLVPWNIPSNDSSATHSGLNLISDSSYYFSLRATNKAGLSGIAISDGAIVLKSNSLSEMSEASGTISPNPFQDRFTLQWRNKKPEVEKIGLYDSRGRRIPVRIERIARRKVRIVVKEDLSSGVHFLWVHGEGENSVHRVVRK